MLFDPARRVRETLWVTGSQWAGKSTVSGIVARRHGTLVYRYDYHRNRGHLDRQRMLLNSAGRTLPDPEQEWLGRSPREMAESALELFRLRFDWVLDDLSALDGDVPVLAEGWGLLPDLVAAVAADPRQVIVLVATPQWRHHQVENLGRARRFSAAEQVSDPAQAWQNRHERDLLIAEETVRQANRRGIRILEIDGRRDTAAVADSVAGHFAPFLPPPSGPGRDSGSDHADGTQSHATSPSIAAAKTSMTGSTLASMDNANRQASSSPDTEQAIS